MSFKRATRKNAKLRLALSGTAGAGKTYSALVLAQHFGRKIAVMDSERGSASLYAGAPGIPEFDVCELEEKNVQEYLEKIAEAAAEGYEVLVIDSYSHSWLGALETVDKMGGSKFSNGWKVVSPLVTKLVDAILSYPGHVIATMREKAEFAVETVNGKAVPKKLGMATVARDGTDYEFSVMLGLTPEGGVTVSKTRCSALAGGAYTREDMPRLAKTLRDWLNEGAPRSAVDEFADRVRATRALPELEALLPELKGLPDTDKPALGPVYKAQKAKLTEEAGT
jgi:hypothetical protein